MATIGLCCSMKAFSTCSYSLVVVYRLLIAVASFVTEHELRSVKASVVVVHGLSYLSPYGISPDQESNPCALYRQAES